MDKSECLAEFRFAKNIFNFLLKHWESLLIFVMGQRSWVEGIEALCILIKRVAYPCQYRDMISSFLHFLY